MTRAEYIECLIYGVLFGSVAGQVALAWAGHAPWTQPFAVAAVAVVVGALTWVGRRYV